MQTLSSIDPVRRLHPVDSARVRAALWRALLPVFPPLAAAWAQQPASGGPPSFQFIEVVPGVYATVEPRANALSPFVHGNSMFVVNDSDVVVFDANRTPSAARKTLAQLRQVTNKPIRRLVISHFHGDHTLGIEAFVEANPAIEIIATDSTRDEMVRTYVGRRRDAAYYAKVNERYDSLATAGVDLAGRPLTPERRIQWAETRAAFRNYYSVEAPTITSYMPTTTFSRTVTLWSGSRRIDAITFGRGDTRGDAVLWLPKERVVATGDLLVDPAPYSGAEFPSEFLRSLRAIRALDPLHIVPGHGNVMHDTKYLDLVIAATDSALHGVALAVADNLSEDDAVKRVTLGAFRAAFTHGDPLVSDRFDDFQETVVRGAYQEIKKSKTHQ